MLDIPGLGNQAAKTVCEEMKIRTQGDKKLEEAKKLLYLKGFNDGVMFVGNHKGKKVTARMYCLVMCMWLTHTQWLQTYPNRFITITGVDVGIGLVGQQHHRKTSSGLLVAVF